MLKKKTFQFCSPPKYNAFNEAEENIKKGMYETSVDKWTNTLYRKIQLSESATKKATTGTTIRKKGQATAEICDGITRDMKNGSSMRSQTSATVS